MAKVERLWAMTRIVKGAYLLPSNDRSRFWLLRSYVEDGSLTEQDGKGGWRTVRGTFWSAYYFDGTPEAFASMVDSMVDVYEDFLWDERWREYSTLWPTRAAAIDDALQAGVV